MTDTKCAENGLIQKSTTNIRTSVVFELAEQLLRQAEIQYKNDNKFSDETLLSLNSLFGPVLERALDLLDNGKFVMYQSHGSLRKVLRVKGSKKEEYTLFHHINFCTCPAYKYNVLHSSKELLCKHVLAVRLAEIADKIIIETYTNKQIADILNNLIV